MWWEEVGRAACELAQHIDDREEEAGKAGKGKKEMDRRWHIKKCICNYTLGTLVNRKNCIYLKTNNTWFEIQSPKKHTRLTPVKIPLDSCQAPSLFGSVILCGKVVTVIPHDLSHTKPVKR